MAHGEYRVPLEIAVMAQYPVTNAQ